MVGSGGGDDERAGPSKRPSAAAVVGATPPLPTGVPVVDLAATIGPVGDTYREEFEKLKAHVLRSGDLLAPSAPVIFVNAARDLYATARKVVSDKQLSPHNKCALLFQIFDAVVLVYKNVSLVYCDGDGARSVYGYSELALKALLSRIEAIARQVAVCVHDAHSLTVLNDVVSTTEQRLSQVRTEHDMLEFFRAASGGPADSVSAVTATGSSLPRGVELYKDPFPEAAALMRRLYATNSHVDYVRDFHDTMFLIATSNAPATLSSALETRLADKDRNIVLFEAAGDRMFASAMCASAIAFLRQRLCGGGAGGHASSPRRAAGGVGVGDVETYRINYGRVFSKYRGDSERNFDNLMEWIKKKVRASDRFRVFWFPDIENLMSPRSSGDQEHIAAMKNSMLQHMDAFNKDRTLRSFLLLFNSSEGVLDSAFSRRLETVVKTPPNPLTDSSVAMEVVGAELARYHMNLSDELVASLAVQAGTMDESQNSRVGGFARVQAALREMYVNQKLALSYDARSIDASTASSAVVGAVLGRYLADGSHDKLYDLDENLLTLADVGAIAFGPASRLATQFAGSAMTAFKYNANIRGDPKDIGGRGAARTVFLHHV